MTPMARLKGLGDGTDGRAITFLLFSDGVLVAKRYIVYKAWKGQLHGIHAPHDDIQVPQSTQ